MEFFTAIQKTGIIDLKQLRRESFLVYLMVMPILYSVLIRVFVPLAAAQLRETFDLESYYPLVVSALVVETPVLMGTVIGFL